MNTCSTVSSIQSAIVAAVKMFSHFIVATVAVLLVLWCQVGQTDGVEVVEASSKELIDVKQEVRSVVYFKEIYPRKANE